MTPEVFSKGWVLGASLVPVMHITQKIKKNMFVHHSYYRTQCTHLLSCSCKPESLWQVFIDTYSLEIPRRSRNVASLSCQPTFERSESTVLQWDSTKLHTIPTEFLAESLSQSVWHRPREIGKHSSNKNSFSFAKGKFLFRLDHCKYCLKR